MADFLSVAANGEEVQVIGMVTQTGEAGSNR